MSMAEEMFNEYMYEMEQELDFSDLTNEIKISLSKKSDSEILETAIKQGEELNEVTGYFPAYNVALKIKNNNWTPAPKQKQAIINVTAYFIARKQYEEDKPHLWDCPSSPGGNDI